MHEKGDHQICGQNLCSGTEKNNLETDIKWIYMLLLSYSATVNNFHSNFSPHNQCMSHVVYSSGMSGHHSKLHLHKDSTSIRNANPVL